MTDPPPVAVVSTGAANLASVVAALERVRSVTPVVTDDPDDVRRAPFAVLPGVGAFGPAMARLRERGLVEPLRQRIERGAPTLAICLGLQLLARASEESPGTPGLGIFDAPVTVPGRLERRLVLARRSIHRRHPARKCRRVPVPPRTLRGLRPRPLAFVVCAPGAGSRPMLTRRIIPCLDTHAGRVVKGVQFRRLRDAGTPVDLARRYEAEGADELIVLDVSATPEQRRTCAELIAVLRADLGIPITVGGGVRTIDDASRLLDAGADKIGINSAAIARPSLITSLADRFGRQCIVVAIDALRTGPTWHVVTRSGTTPTRLGALEWASEAGARGAGEILLTSIDRDGGLSGYDLGLIRLVSSRVTCPVIASGGAAGPRHMLEAFESGADAALAASIFHDARFTIRDVKSFLARASVEIRL